MEYVKLYVSLRDDPKIIGLSDRAFRAYVNALCWCGFHETDGLLAVGMMPQKLIDELRAAGLVDGWAIHNWPKFQRTHAELEALRTERREAGRSGGLAKAKAVANQTPSELPSKNVADLEVEVRSRDLEPKNLAPNGADAKTPHQILSEALLATDCRAQYLLGRLRTRTSEDWTEITNAVLMKLGKKYGASAVIEALGECWEYGAIPMDVYSYLESICVRLAAVSA